MSIDLYHLRAESIKVIIVALINTGKTPQEVTIFCKFFGNLPFICAVFMAVFLSAISKLLFLQVVNVFAFRFAKPLFAA